MRTRENLIKIHLTEDEAAHIKACADMCGLTQSTVMRMLILGRRPRPLPPTLFWKILEDMYIIHGILQSMEKRRELETVILQLQAAVTLPEKVV